MKLIALEKGAFFLLKNCGFFVNSQKKTYVVSACWKRLHETLPTSTHNVYFSRELRKVVV